jgi:autotransporter-associated beta strand protein
MANNGTATVDSTMTALLTSLFMGGLDGSSGNITMSGGTFNVTNTGGTAFQSGYGANSSGTFTLNGGTLTIARPSTSNRYFQDSFQPGQTVGSTGTITVNNGTLNILCGMEVGIDGTGIINVNGGTFMDNGWFTLGRSANANSVAPGFFNQTSGNAYHLRNPGTDSTVRIAYGANCNGTFSISGGNFYCVGMKLCANNSAGTATLNVDGGIVYVGELGITAGTATGAVKAINVSGGSFRTVLIDANATGQSGLSAVHVGGPGTNWTWAAANMPVVNLTNSPGFGQVIFVPDAGKTITLNNTWTGPGSFDLNGPGTLAIGGTNTYTGGTGMTQGTLLLNASEPSSFISDIDVLGGTLALAAPQVSAPMGLVHFASGTTLQMNNNALIIDSTFTISNGVTLNFNGTTTQTFTNNVAGIGNVTVTMGGNGMELATGTLNHTGTTTVSSGTLVVGGTLSNGSGVLVTNTGTLAGGGSIFPPIVVASTTLASAHLRMGNSPMNVPGTLTVGSLTLGSGSEVDFKLGNTTTTGSGVNDFLVVNGPLTINSNAFVNILPMQGLAAGSYVLIQYTTLTGQFTNTVTGLTRYGMSLDYSTPNQIKLNVTGSNANLAWRGTNSNWDVLTTSNWLNGVTATTFAEGDAVTFDDTPTNHNVVVASTLYPASITFNNSSNYSLTGSGSGRISGGTGITKNGTGTVTLLSGLGLANDFTGPVNINNGILKMNGALSLGATNGATTVASGATLDLNAQTPNAEPMFIQGAGFGGTNGAINNSGGQVNLAGGPRNITLQGDTTLNASGGRWDMGLNTLGAGGGSFTGNGYKLTKIGTQQIWMHEMGDIGVGDILVSQSLLGFQYNIGMGNAANTISVMPGATFGIWHAVNTLSKQVVLTNGATLYSDGEAGSSNALSGTITLYGPAANTIQVNQPLGILSAMAGSGGYTKTGPGTLYLPAANTYSGPTTVSAGNILLGPSGSIANSTKIALAASTLLDASLPSGGLTLSSGQTLSGSGAVNGNTTAGTGTQIAPGTTTTAGTLTLNNNLTLSGGTNLIKLSGDPSQIGNGVNDLVNVSGTLNLGGVSTIAISPLGVLNTASPYSVMQYSSGSPVSANFQLVSTSPRYSVSLVDPTTTAPYIQVTMTGNPGTLIWKGGATSKSNLWDNVATNWLNVGTSLRDAYFGGDQAILDDTATTNLINLTASVVGVTSLSNNLLAYTITGNGSMAGNLDMEGTAPVRLAISNAPNFSTITANTGALIYDPQGIVAYTNYSSISDNGQGLAAIVKAGTNIMVLGGDNSAYYGSIVVTNGVLQYTNIVNLGAPTAPLYATNGGALDIRGIAINAKNVIIAGNGFNGQGALTNSGGGIANVGLANLTLSGDAAIGGLNRYDFVGGGTINGNGFKLTELGPSANLFTGGAETSFGDIHVVAGRLGFQGGGTTMGDVTKTCIVESNAVLTLFGASVTKNLTLNGNATVDSGGSLNTFSGPVTLVGTNNLFGLRVDLAIEAAVGGGGSMVVGDSPVGAGGGTLHLDAANSYSGPTTINSGHSIVVGASSSLGTSSRIQVSSGATLDTSALASFTLGAGQTLLGAGTVNGGNVVFGSGSTLAPGFPDNNTYTLTMSGALSLQTGSTNVVVVKKTTGVANDTVSGLSSVAIAGTLIVSNVANALSAGDAIQLFTASSYSGTFNSIIPATPGANLVWDSSTLDTDGKIRVASGLPTSPTNIVVSVAGNQLTLSWPSSYTGWTVQGQTNPIGLGLRTNWQDVPGSTATNRLVFQINPATGAAFYRMILK